MLNHPNDQVGAEVLAFLSVFMHDGNARVQVKHDSPRPVAYAFTS